MINNLQISTSARVLEVMDVTPTPFARTLKDRTSAAALEATKEMAGSAQVKHLRNV